MAVHIRECESFDDLLARFKREVKRNGTLEALRKKEYFLKPGVAKREKIKEAKRRKRG